MTHFLCQVWEALLKDMPMTAMIRNLGKMTNLGVFEDQANIKIVTDMLGDEKHSRIHPIKVLLFILVSQAIICLQVCEFCAAFFFPKCLRFLRILC